MLTRNIGKHFSRIHPLILYRQAHYGNNDPGLKWTSKSHPTPYDIFHIDVAKFDKKEIRTRFYQMAKLYHPDSSEGSKAENAEKFKLLTAAYDILKDDKKRRDYDRFHMGWERSKTSKHAGSSEWSSDVEYRRTHFSGFGTYSGPFPSYGYNSQPHSNPREPFDGYDYSKFHRAGSTSETSPKNVNYFFIITGLIIVTTYFQFTHLLRSAQATSESRMTLSNNIRDDMERMRLRYQEEDHKNGRINRFLAQRNGLDYYNNYANDHQDHGDMLRQRDLATITEDVKPNLKDLSLPPPKTHDNTSTNPSLSHSNGSS